MGSKICRNVSICSSYFSDLKIGKNILPQKVRLRCGVVFLSAKLPSSNMTPSFFCQKYQNFFCEHFLCENFWHCAMQTYKFHYHKYFKTITVAFCQCVSFFELIRSDYKSSIKSFKVRSTCKKTFKDTKDF